MPAKKFDLFAGYGSVKKIFFGGVVTENGAGGMPPGCDVM